MAIALQLNQPARKKLNRVPKRILDGREPMAELYIGKWQPIPAIPKLSKKERKAGLMKASEELEKVTQAADEAMAQTLVEPPPVPSPAASQPKTKPACSKSLTDSQQHLQACWDAIRQAPPNANTADLCEYYDRAGLKPRQKSWRVPSYLDVPGNDKLEACFRREKSAAKRLAKRLHL